MKEITILSGKGGTGKTSIAAALASVSENMVFADTDVDAADLHIILQPQIKETHIFRGGRSASINENCAPIVDFVRNIVVLMQFIIGKKVVLKSIHSNAKVVVCANGFVRFERLLQLKERTIIGLCPILVLDL